MAVHAFIFPGQGSQAPGMGRDLAAAFAAAREVFQEVDDTLGQKLSAIMFEGPAETLTLTENAQPALMAHSLAVLRVLESEGRFKLADRAVVVAGHSLGEYSALAAAGAFGIAQAARLLKLRGQAMQKAVPPGAGSMAALLGAEMPLALEICAEAAPAPGGGTEVIEPGNDNGGGQVVISGATAGGIGIYWRPADYGRVAGRSYVAWCLAAVSLPVLAGYLFDTTRQYDTAVLIAAAANIAGMALALTMPRQGWREKG